VLLDFGAARQTLSSDQPMLKPMYTPGFASPEQYKGRDRLGPWSDMYSVGASMYASMAGAAPQAADTRVERDNLVPAVKRWAGKYSDHLLETVDWCMKLEYAERPQSVFVLQRALAQKHAIKAVTEIPPVGWLDSLRDRLRGMINK
jgi:serine/threonine protein kinase